MKSNQQKNHYLLDAIKFINKVLAHEEIQQSMAISEHNDEFDFLPESLKSQIRPQNDEREKFQLPSLILMNP
ncbi:unnamed protein product [Paramecium sonneborni]|uniref:Uncharacterized protein n=1 Tax=Paramecium sonneborni TaxID=65129 RepID=A0A8S1RJ57_9CILI|nr:unnamed protein product [Paramecium sonneborni]